VIGVDQVMTDVNDGSGAVRPSAPADPGADAAITAPGGTASAHPPTVDSGSGEHPGVVMRPGPAGRRAALCDGPDVWEVIAALHALRDEDPNRHGEALAGDLCAVTRLTAVQVAAALDYYTADPDDIDTRIGDNDDTAEPAQRPPTAGGPPPCHNRPT